MIRSIQAREAILSFSFGENMDQFAITKSGTFSIMTLTAILKRA